MLNSLHVHFLELFFSTKQKSLWLFSQLLTFRKSYDEKLRTQKKTYTINPLQHIAFSFFSVVSRGFY